MSDIRRTRRTLSVISLAISLLLALSACSPAGPAGSNVQVTSPTVTPQGQLSLHAIATFEVSVQDPNGLHKPEDLRYHWSLDAERGTYLQDGDEEALEVVTRRDVPTSPASAAGTGSIAETTRGG